MTKTDAPLNDSSNSPEAPYLLPPMFIGKPDAKHALQSRKFQGIPSLAISPAGRLWATWYAGSEPAEDHNNYVVLASSADGGATWEEALIVDPDGPGPVRAFDPELWLDPCGRLWLFWAQSIGHEGAVAGVWTVTTDNPDVVEPSWTPPRRISDGVMMCKPLALSSGAWMLPVSTWRNTDNSAKAVVSMDQGVTWKVAGGCHVPPKDRDYDEHNIVERSDRSLWMLVRTAYGIGESVSADYGKTWTPLAPSGIHHPSSRFFVRRLNSGNLLLVKHGPVGERTDRSLLSAYISRDDGATWGGGLLLDERKNVSYPDGEQAKAGTIHIVYDYSRTDSREILMAVFREEDVWSGDSHSSTISLRIPVSCR